MVSQKRIRRKPEGETKNRIIDLLGKEPYRQRFTELRKALNISKPVLAEHLHDLKKEGKITYDRIGKAVYYMLSDKAWDRPDIRIHQFGSLVMSYINGELTAWGSDATRLQKLSEKEVLAKLARKLSASILFTHVKSAETNQEWYKAAEHIARDIEPLIKRRIIYPDFDYKIWNRPLGEIDKLKSKIERFYKALRELYPEEMKVLEQVYNNPKVLKDPKTGKIRVEYKTPPQTIA